VPFGSAEKPRESCKPKTPDEIATKQNASRTIPSGRGVSKRASSVFTGDGRRSHERGLSGDLIAPIETSRPSIPANATQKPTSIATNSQVPTTSGRTHAMTVIAEAKPALTPVIRTATRRSDISRDVGRSVVVAHQMGESARGGSGYAVPALEFAPT
jgi:hypothetical protein